VVGRYLLDLWLPSLYAFGMGRTVYVYTLRSIRSRSIVGVFSNLGSISTFLYGWRTVSRLSNRCYCRGWPGGWGPASLYPYMADRKQVLADTLRQESIGARSLRF